MQTKLKKILIFFLLIATGCNKNKTTKQQVESKRIYLYTGYKNTLMQSVMLAETHLEFNARPFLLKSLSENKNLNFSFDLNSPKLYKFYSYIPMSVPLLIYVTPGDTLNYRLENQIITFEGKNEAHYNFFKELNDLNLQYPNYDEELGIAEYKKKSNAYYKKKADFLNRYAKNKTVSKAFIIKIKNVFKYEHINMLANRNLIENAIISDYSEYLEGITLNTFNRNDQDDNVYFFLALNSFLDLVTEEKFNYNEYSKEALNYKLDLITKNLKNSTKEYAITKTLSEYNEHLDTNIVNHLKEKIDMYLHEIDNESYKEVLTKIKRRLRAFSHQLPDQVHRALLFDQEGRNFSLKEILQKQGDKIKIIDFWASWCAPCIKDIKNTYLYRKQLVKKNNVEFIYISIDNNQEKWNKKITELKPYGMDKNQYLVSDPTHSTIKSFFNVSAIPYYVILDKNNNVFLMNAPHPDDTLEFNDVLRKINLGDE